MNVINHLGTLETAGLVRLAQVVPDLEYLFRHTLVQDAAYASLLRIDQQRLHLEVGEALEHLYPERLDELAPALARHFGLAGEAARSLKYYQRAAELALATYANQEAESHLQAALSLASGAEKPDQGVQAEILCQLGGALYHQSRFAEAIQSWEQAIELFRQQNNYDQVGRWVARSARAAWYENRIADTLKICQAGMDSLAGAPESPGVAELVHETARAYYFNSLPEKALLLCRQALEMAERLGALDVQADALTTLGILPDITADEALKALEKAVSIAEGENLLAIASRAHINLGTATREHLADYQAANKHFLRSAELARRRGALQEEIFALMGSVNVLNQIGELDESEKMNAALEKLARALPNPGNIGYQLRANDALIKAQRGRWEEASGLFQGIYTDALERGDVRLRRSFADVLMRAHLEMVALGLPCDLTAAEKLGDFELQEQMANSDASVQFLSTSLLSNLTSVKALLGKQAEADVLLEKARQTITLKDEDSWMPVLDAELTIADINGQLGERVADFERFIPIRKRINVYFYGRLLTRWARACMLHGDADDLEKAQTLLLEALDIFEKLRADRLVDGIRTLLAASRVQTMAQAVDQKRVAQEMAMAARIQGSFLPVAPPQMPGWQISVAFKPARQTSGDYYDFIPLPDGKLGIVIADVADKGMGAALYMASTRSLLRAYIVDFAEKPAMVFARANQRLTADTHGGLFVTIFYGVLNPKTGEMVYINAGHNPPYLFSAEAEPCQLTKTGIPLGVFNDTTWQEAVAQVDPGALLVMYTDGVTEAINKEEVPFGEGRLLAAVRKAQRNALPGDVAEAVRRGLLAEIEYFRGPTLQADDITLCVLAHLPG